MRPYAFDVTIYTDVLLRSMSMVLSGQLGLALWEPDRIFHEEEGVIMGFGEFHFRWDDAAAGESYRFRRTLAQRRGKEEEPTTERWAINGRVGHSR